MAAVMVTRRLPNGALRTYPVQRLDLIGEQRSLVERVRSVERLAQSTARGGA